MAQSHPPWTTVAKLALCCALAAVLAAALMFPFAGGIGVLSNQASEVVATGSTELLAQDVPQVSTITDVAGNVIANNTYGVWRTANVQASGLNGNEFFNVGTDVFTK